MADNANPWTVGEGPKLDLNLGGFGVLTLKADSLDELAVKVDKVAESGLVESVKNLAGALEGLFNGSKNVESILGATLESKAASEAPAAPQGTLKNEAKESPKPEPEAAPETKPEEPKPTKPAPGVEPPQVSTFGKAVFHEGVDFYAWLDPRPMEAKKAIIAQAGQGEPLFTEDPMDARLPTTHIFKVVSSK